MKFIFSKAEVFALPSVHEIFGMVLLEAMYFKTAIVSSHSAGAETLIENNISGIVIDDCDQYRWAETIKYLLDDKDLRNAFGRAAHERIIERFSWEAIAEIMMQSMSV